MKPIHEKVPSADNGHFFVGVRREPAFAPFWHFHPEIELTLITAGSGRRFVGDRIEPYAPGDLVLLGPGLTHNWTSDQSPPRKPPRHEAIFVQFTDAFLGPGHLDRPAFRPVRQLLDRAARGLRFSGAVRDDVAARLGRLPAMTPLLQIAEMLHILERLATAPPSAPIASHGSAPAAQGLTGEDRLTRVYRHLETCFRDVVSLAEVAAIAAMSPSAFSTYFRKATGRTLSTYLTDLRLTRACQLLAETEMTIGRVAEEAGYRNMALFNRQFSRRHGTPPRLWRSVFRRAHQRC